MLQKPEMSAEYDNEEKIMNENQVTNEEQPATSEVYHQAKDESQLHHDNEVTNSSDPQTKTNEVKPVTNKSNDEEGKDTDESDPEFDQDHTEIDSNKKTSPNKDYAKLFEKYQERFYKVYSVSQKLFQNEVSQRETLSFYQRRNNALIDLLDKFESGKQETTASPEILSNTDISRIENLISMNPKLQSILSPLLAIDDLLQQLKHTHKINLLINEAIPELINDDTSNFELNPQDIEPWVRRHYPNLIISKYKPISINANKFNESIELTTANKKKRKVSKDDEAEESVQSKKSKK